MNHQQPQKPDQCVNHLPGLKCKGSARLDKSNKIMLGFTGCGKTHRTCFIKPLCVRARLQSCRKCCKINGPLGPEGCFSGVQIQSRPFSAACLAPAVLFSTICYSAAAKAGIQIGAFAARLKSRPLKNANLIRRFLKIGQWATKKLPHCENSGAVFSTALLPARFAAGTEAGAFGAGAGWFALVAGFGEASRLGPGVRAGCGLAGATEAGLRFPAETGFSFSPRSRAWIRLFLGGAVAGCALGTRSVGPGRPGAGVRGWTIRTGRKGTFALGAAEAGPCRSRGRMARGLGSIRPLGAVAWAGVRSRARAGACPGAGS